MDKSSSPIPRFRRLLAILPYLLAAIGVPAIVLVAQRSNPALREARPVVEPAAPGFPTRIAGRGIVESAGDDVRISPPLGAVVREVAVQVGDDVAENALLFRLDDRQARAELARQVARLAVLAQRETAARLEVEDRRDVLERQEKLARASTGTAEELIRARFALRRAEAQEASASAERNAAAADLDALRVGLAVLEVRAPRAGRILQVNVRVGEFAETGWNRPAVVLGRTDRLQVRIEVDEGNAGRVVPGSPAVGQVQGGRGELLPLRFARIEPYLVPKRSLAGDSLERVDTRVLQIIYELEPGALRIYPGQQIEAWIEESAGGQGQRR